jgi:hypothetical protein
VGKSLLADSCPMASFGGQSSFVGQASAEGEVRPAGQPSSGGYPPPRLVVAADTLVVLGSGSRKKVIGKPATIEEARSMLSRSKAAPIGSIPVYACSTWRPGTGKRRGLHEAAFRSHVRSGGGGVSGERRMAGPREPTGFRDGLRIISMSLRDPGPAWWACQYVSFMSFCAVPATILRRTRAPGGAHIFRPRPGFPLGLAVRE